MKSAILLVLPAIALAISPPVTGAEVEIEAKGKAAAEVFRTEVTPFLKTYCVECHGHQRFKGGINFAGISHARIAPVMLITNR